MPSQPPKSPPTALPSRLTSLKLPEAVPGLSLLDKLALADEVRANIIQVVSQNGGHLAPSLGVVELTIALLSSFNPAQDHIVWDVGHQTYPWKLLTGRAAAFHTLRQYGGISGFPKREESPYDHFGVGHASTSLSAALGMAHARDLRGGKEHVVAIIGDGSLTGGMAFEAMNHAGGEGRRLIVVLNDNNMSISKSVGALSLFLSRSLSGTGVMQLKTGIGAMLERIPKVGTQVVDLIRRGEYSFKTFFTSGMLFEALGFNYIGPVDGHNIEQIIRHLDAVKNLDYPVLLHVRTQKGHGYAPAERNPSKFHGVSAFEPDTGLSPPPTPSDDPVGPGFSQAFGQALCELGENRKDLMVISAAMPDGTGTSMFQARFPEHFVDVGICEEHAVTFAAGLASQGMRPVVAIYSTFMQRAYDQILHDVCLQNLPVILCLDRAGLVGEDGPTHHGAFDLSWLRSIPGLTICAPRDEEDLRNALFTALQQSGPVAIRYPRGCSRSFAHYLENSAHSCNTSPFTLLPVGQGEMLLEGNTSLCIINAGHRAFCCVEAARILEQELGQSPSVFDARWVKPLPKEQLLALARRYKSLLLVEENSLAGGFSSAVLEFLADQNALDGLRIRRMGLPDAYVTQGPVRHLRAELGLDTQGIVTALKEML